MTIDTTIITYVKKEYISYSFSKCAALLQQSEKLECEVNKLVTKSAYDFGRELLDLTAEHMTQPVLLRRLVCLFMSVCVLTFSPISPGKPTKPAGPMSP